MDNRYHEISVINGKDEQEVKYQILSTKREIKRDKIASAVMAGAGVAGSLVLAALSKNGTIALNNTAVDKVLMASPAVFGLMAGAGSYADAYMKEKKLNDLVESIRNNQSLKEFAQSYQNGELNYERGI